MQLVSLIGTGRQGVLAAAAGQPLASLGAGLSLAEVDQGTRALLAAQFDTDSYAAFSRYLEGRGFSRNSPVEYMAAVSAGTEIRSVAVETWTSTSLSSPQDVAMIAVSREGGSSQLHWYPRLLVSDHTVRQLSVADDGSVSANDYDFGEESRWGVPGGCTICQWACGAIVGGVVGSACTAACAAGCGPAAPLCAGPCSFACTALVGAPIGGGCYNACDYIGWC